MGKFKVGDRVRVVDKDKLKKLCREYVDSEGNNPNPKNVYVVGEMLEVAGSEFTISEEYRLDLDRYRLQEFGYYWSGSMLELVEEDVDCVGDFKVGDSVRIVENLVYDEYYDDVLYVDSMKFDEVKKIVDLDEAGIYIEDDPYHFNYSKSMLEKVPEFKEGDKVTLVDGLENRKVYGGSIYVLGMEFKGAKEVLRVVSDSIIYLKDSPVSYSAEMLEKVEESDMVNNPAHYQHGGIETLDIIKTMLSEEEFKGYLKGNILKYRERAEHKGNATQDYAKAKFYYDMLNPEDSVQLDSKELDLGEVFDKDLNFEQAKQYWEKGYTVQSIPSIGRLVYTYTKKEGQIEMVDEKGLAMSDFERDRVWKVIETPNITFKEARE